MKTCLTLSIIVSLLVLSPSAEGKSPDLEARGIPILVYHRFGGGAKDSMTVLTCVFESHLRYFRENGHVVIPLRSLVDFYLGKGPAPPPNALVITVDDGHRSVYTEMLPLLMRYQVPATLFIYPSAISNAPYAMTWDQLRTLKKERLFDFQSHTYWHPNFKKEKRRLPPAEYESYVERQLVRSRERLERELGWKVDMLAWPFGIFDEDLIQKAKKAGYVAGFTLEPHPATLMEDRMALPRYLISHSNSEGFPKRLFGASGGRVKAPHG